MNTIAELRYHAGLEQQTTSSTPSLSDVLWRKESANEALDDVLRILETLNVEMNGRIPSESTSGEQSFPRTLIYAVTEIVRLLRESASKVPNSAAQYELNKAAWRIEVAWSAILAGDIDDLKSHIAGEEWAAGLDRL